MKVLVALACVLAIAAAKAVDPDVELPTSLKICKKNDSQRDECIKDSIQTLLSYIRQKQEGLELPAIDPFTSETMSFSYKNSNWLSGNYIVKEVKTYGFGKTKMLSVKSDFTDDQMTIQAESFIPKLFSTGDYSSSMTFSSLKLAAKGQFNITMKDVKAKWTVKGKLENIDGEDYMKVYEFDIIPEPNDMKISLSGLFPDEQLNNVANGFFNQYWRILFNEMLPETRKQWEPILLKLVNKFFAQIPFRRLLL